MGSIIDVARVNAPVPPNKCATPKIRARNGYAIAWLVIRVFPRVVGNESDLIDILVPKSLNLVKSLFF